MVKRRNVIMGLGTLAFGSGATTFSGAFSSNTTNPTSELRVLADARLRVKAPGTIPSPPSAFSGATDAVKKSTLDAFTDPAFDRSSLPTAQIDSDDENDNYTIKAGVTTGVNVSFNGVMEIVNNDGTSHDVAINYGDYDDSSTDGYGSDVDTSSFDNSSSSVLDPKAVQEIYKFKIPNDGNYLPGAASTSTKLLSPDPTVSDDKYNETVTIGDGQSAILILDYDTTGKAGIINQAAAGGNPFQASSYVSLLEQMWVEVDP